MVAESLYCPSCGAPLSFNTGQTVMICVYCNSSIRVLYQNQSKLSLTPISEISAEAVDEVKRLLIMGSVVKAVDYYIQISGLNRTEAVVAVSAIKKTTGYKPPLSFKGLVIIISLFSISFGGLAGGIYLLYSGKLLPGLFTDAVSVLFAFINWFAFNGSLNAYFILKNGIEAQAVILKRWHVTSYPLKQGGESHLLRLLVEVRPSGSTAFQAETNCLVSELKNDKLNPGSAIMVKYKRNNPMSVIVSGME